ncbi:MAG: manganese efflux pump [Clostridiales bacterium]|nr:manganese efflux pump [Clostridiales bacterium]
MDAFAVAMGKGLCMRKIQYGYAVVIAFFFGGFQALMPVLGWLLGRQFSAQIESLDHWIAFVLLSLIGLKMIWGAYREKNTEAEPCDLTINYRELFVLSVATSIDALAAGVTFALLHTPIALAAAVIGSAAFVISFGGVIIGQMFGVRFKTKAEYFGGGVLILIGLKILLEHLGILF